MSGVSVSPIGGEVTHVAMLNDVLLRR